MQMLNLRTDENCNPYLDKQIEELEEKVVGLKVVVADVKENMDNVNDDMCHYDKRNKMLKNALKNQDKELDDLKQECLMLKQHLNIK